MVGLAPILPSSVRAEEQSASTPTQETSRPYRFGLDYLAQPIVNPVGGLSTEASWLNGLWLQLELGRGLNLDPAQWQELDHWVFKLETALVRGNSAYYRQVGAAYPLQSMTSAGQWLSELTIRREPGASSVGVKAGVFSLNPGFMESDVFNFYVHSSINDTFNNEVLAIPIAPLTSLGVQVTLGQQSITPSHQLRLGAFTVVPSDTFGQSIEPGLRPLRLEGAIGLLQWQYGLGSRDRSKAQQGRSAEGAVPDLLPAPGVMLGGFWSETSPSQAAATAAAPLPDGVNRGVYATATLPLPSVLKAGLQSRAWLAGQYGLDWANNPAPVFWGAGVLIQGLFPGRPLDVTGVAGTSTGFSPTINPGQNQESVLEINHQIQISSALSLKPFAQLIVTPNGMPSRPPILATGLQAAISF